ncbi:MAG: PaaI family thioesterase [Rhizobiales bacterium]|nr:PaaI family thioesterase [Hyphomicrobiales bacterium]
MPDQTKSPESGLQYLRQLIAEWKQSPMAEALNMRLIAADQGTATFEAFPSAQFYNPQRRMHGGYVATLLDSALGCAVQTVLPADEGYGTVELKVNFVRKLTAETGRILCKATVLHAGSRMQTAEGKVMDEAGKLYAHGSGTFLVYRP